MTAYIFVGVTRRGGSASGVFEAECCAEFIEAKYKARWQALSVRQKGQPPDEECGAICLHPETGRRVWWAET